MPSATKTKTTHVSPLYASPVETADGRILPTHGPFVCRWIETNCVNGEGDYFGEPIRLRRFQRRFLYRLYEYYPETGERRYRRALWTMGKGNGKTPMAACIGAFELAGGMNVSPLVLVGAASLKQADLVFGDLRTMATISPTLKRVLEPFDLEILLRGGRPGRAERIAAAVGTNDGPRATCFLADELHEWLGRLGRTFRIVDGAIAKRRRGFTAAFSTAGIDDPELELKKLYDYGRRVASGTHVDDAFLFESYEAPEGLDLDDPKQWLEGTLASNPAAGDFNSLENIRSRFDGAQAVPRAEFERYHWNRWTKTEGTWEVAVWWDALKHPRIKLDAELPLTVMVDVGLRNDSSSIVWAQAKGERVVVRSKTWENPYPETDDRHERWTVPTDALQAQLVELFEAFPKRARGGRRGPAFFYDPAYFHESADALAREHKLNMIEYPQTDQRMMPASLTLFQLVKSGRLTHDGDPVLSRHIHSVTPHEKPRGFRISKPRGSPVHIDAAVATAVAVHEATRAEHTQRPLLYTGASGEETE